MGSVEDSWRLAITMRLFIFALSLAVVAAAGEKRTSSRDGRAFPSPENRITLDSSASREHYGVLSSLFRMGHAQSNARSGMDMVANPVGKKRSASKNTSPIEKSSPSFRYDCCYKVSVSPMADGGFISYQRDSYGDYYRQSFLINNGVWYKNYENDKCIWWSYPSSGHWILGKCSKRGSEYGHFTNHEDADCPHDPGLTWKVTDGDDWYDANRRMSVWCED